METWIATMFHQGGPAMYSIEYIGVPALLIALFHAIRPRKWSAWAGIGLASLALLIGLYSWHDNRGKVDDWIAAEERDPDTRTTAAERQHMHDDGYLEALRPLQFGAIVAGICALPLLVGELRRRRQTRTRNAS
jgi:hypothetical protein